MLAEKTPKLAPKLKVSKSQKHFFLTNSRYVLEFHKNLQTIRIGFVKIVSFDNQSLLPILVKNCQEYRVDVQKGVELTFLNLIYDAIIPSTCKNNGEQCENLPFVPIPNRFGIIAKVKITRGSYCMRAMSILSQSYIKCIYIPSMHSG